MTPGARWEWGSSGGPEKFFSLLFGNKGSYWRQPLRKISFWSFSKELCSFSSVTSRKTALDCDKNLDQVSHNRAKKWLHLRDTESWRKEHCSGINQWCNTEPWSSHEAYLSSLSGEAHSVLSVWKNMFSVVHVKRLKITVTGAHQDGCRAGKVGAFRKRPNFVRAVTQNLLGAF